ncbi:unnamed protein product, partial [Phaeothamnion confervicola]
THGTFEALSPVDPQSLAQLRSMGFSEGMCLQALRRGGSVEDAVNWLFQQSTSGGSGDTNGSGRGGGGSSRSASTARGRAPDAVTPVSGLPFVLCSAEEASLLHAAAGRLVNEAELVAAASTAVARLGTGAADRSGGSGSGGRGGTVTAVSGVIGDAGPNLLLRAFRSPIFQSVLNVTAMRPEFLPDLIRHSLPREWTAAAVGGDGDGGVGARIAVLWTPGRGGHPDAAWFRKFWAYLSRRCPHALAFFAESWPVVPTNEGVVCSLSVRAAVVASELLDDNVRHLLVALGGRTLMGGLFQAEAGPAAARGSAAAAAGATGAVASVPAGRPAGAWAGIAPAPCGPDGADGVLLALA